MRGKDLKKIIDDYTDSSGIGALEIITKSGIPKRTYYDLFDKDKVKEHYLRKLEQIGITVRDSAKNSALDKNNNSDSNVKHEQLLITFEQLRRHNEQLSKIIDEVLSRNKELSERVKEVQSEKVHLITTINNLTDGYSTLQELKTAISDNTDFLKKILKPK